MFVSYFGIFPLSSALIPAMCFNVMSFSSSALFSFYPHPAACTMEPFPRTETKDCKGCGPREWKHPETRLSFPSSLPSSLPFLKIVRQCEQYASKWVEIRSTQDSARFRSTFFFANQFIKITWILWRDQPLVFTVHRKMDIILSLSSKRIEYLCVFDKHGEKMPDAMKLYVIV